MISIEYRLSIDHSTTYIYIGKYCYVYSWQYMHVKYKDPVLQLKVI